MICIITWCEKLLDPYSEVLVLEFYSGPYLGFFVCRGKLRLWGQTPQTFTGIFCIQTGFLVKHYVRKKISFHGGGNCPPCPPPPPLCTALLFESLITQTLLYCLTCIISTPFCFLLPDYIFMIPIL